MSTTAKMLGVAIPVIVATALCLTVPFVIILADAAILAAAIVAFASERVSTSPSREQNLPELE